MIKTRYKIALQIDEDTFNIEFVTPSKAKQEEFKKSFEQYDKIFEELNEKQNEVEFMQTTMELNKESIDSTDDKEQKLKLLNEQKKNLSTLKKLKEQLKQIGKKEINLDELAKSRFAVSTVGADKASLMAVIEQKNISYLGLMEEIESLVSKAKEKK